LLYTLLLTIMLSGQAPRPIRNSALPRFVNPVFDPGTNLLWTRPAVGIAVEAKSAISYCKRLKIGGLKNWRLPTGDEIGTLERSDHTPQGLNLGKKCYFTSQKDNYGENEDYCFGRGPGAFRALNSTSLVLCVHSVSR
jgi:hypothetical protein